MAKITTLGRELVRRSLPDGYKQWADKTLDKKAITELTTALAKEDPDTYVEILQSLNAIGEQTVSDYGRDAALSYTDSVPGREIRNLNKKLHAIIDQVLDDPKLTEEQKEDKIKELGYKYTQKIQDLVFEDQDKRHTALASQINSGSRGNKTQLMQLMFGNMMMKDALNRDIPYLHMDPFVDGTSPMAYWISSSAGRKGMYDVQAATGQAGYLGKQVTNVTHDVVIEKDDCGTTDTGVPFKAADSQNVGHVLLRPFHNHPAGSIVTPEMVAEADDDEEMMLRTPITCKCKYGVCARCNGLGENGKFPGTGEYVALNSARTFVEKVTQAGISCLHQDTLVRMGDWSVKAIKDISPGEEVLGFTHEHGTFPCTVKRIFHNGMQPMYRLKLQNTEYLSYDHIDATLYHRFLRYAPNGNPVMWTMNDILPDDVEHVPCVPNDYMSVNIRKDGLHHATLPGSEGCPCIIPIGEFEAYDMEVDNADNLYVLACGIITHNSKHGSGIGGKKNEDPDGEDQPTGFANMERMFQVPQNFPGGAVLAPMDGVVTSIRPAPQGGNYVTVGTQTVYCQPERTFKVKVGDKVTAGDVLTNGVPNPSEVVAYKGVGQGRRYYMNKLGDIFKRSGFGVDRTNLESFTRSFLNKVRITDENGYRSWLPGEVVSYSEIAAEYEPRDNAVDETPDKAMNKYLEAPVLYYTIGTRVTPSVASELNKYGFNKVKVSPDPPPFQSELLKPSIALQNDRNWLPRLAGERLYDSLFDAARKGKTDSYDSPSYVDKIVASPFKQ